MTDSNTIKVLTIHQPYASFLVFGIKQFETGRPFTNYRGEIYIHAAKNPFPNKDKLKANALFNEHIENREVRAEAMLSLSFSGVIFGVTTITDCLYTVLKESDPSPKQRPKIAIPSVSELEKQVGFWTKDQYVYAVKNSQKLKLAIPADGRQGLWNLPESLIGDIQSVTPASYANR